ncbi:MAG: hypothetical protein AB8B56_13430 [Crocinitomicaceae bacterium]
MKAFLHLKKSLLITSVLTLLFLGYGCQKNYEPPGSLSVNSIFITQTDHTPYLDLPGYVVIFNQPDFDINDPSTWTGQVEQYVVNRYKYTVQFHITNSGKGTAYDTELDVGYFYDDGSDVFETFYIGNVSSYGEETKTVEIVSYNKQLEECGAEVYWYDS